ncbi:hypothetical protein SVIOM74S_00902 [Streptomyces violarus]
MNRILIVEDEERIASFVEKGLRSNGFTTTVVTDGDAGCEYALTGGFDLVVLDIGLPGRDGFTVIPQHCSTPTGYRWGSWNREGGVNIHWAAMQLPSRLIDYVLVHEFAHLHKRDHSPEFWSLVGRALPDYRERRDQLDQFGALLWLPEPVTSSK